MTFDIERELARAMSAAVEDLPAPRLDLARIRRRRSRRFFLPTLIVTAGATAIAPIAAVSQSGWPDSRPVGDVADPAHAATTSPRPAPASTTPPPEAGVLGEKADAVSVPTATASAACWTAPRELTTGERAGVVRQVRQALAAEEAALNERLAGMAKVSVSLPKEGLDQLVPATGTLVEHSGCGEAGKVSRKAAREIAAEAAAVVRGIAAVLHDTIGKLGLRGVPVVVAVTAAGDGAATVRITIAGGGAVSGTITATLRPGTGKVVGIDTSDLQVAGGSAPQLPDSGGSSAPPELPVPLTTPTLPPVPGLPLPDLPGVS
jgi:hypothetical protein